MQGEKMPGILDHENMHVDDLPGIWSPVQWELTDEERVRELDDQATASLLSSINVPEAILRLLLSETDIEPASSPPPGYDPDLQGEWNEMLTTFKFKRPVELDSVEREAECFTVTYKVEGAGYWVMEFGPERVVIERI
jgi:hypothetical protein